MKTASKPEIFSAADFKKLCYDIESLSYRKWVIEKVFTETYPNSFYHATFKDSSLIFACNIHDPIFVVVDDKINKIANCFEAGFIDSPELKELVELALQEKNIRYNFPDAAFLSLSFYGKEDYKSKLANHNIREDQIDLALGQLNLKHNNYSLSYGGNVGYNLFNYLDD